MVFIIVLVSVCVCRPLNKSACLYFFYTLKVTSYIIFYINLTIYFFNCITYLIQSFINYLLTQFPPTAAAAKSLQSCPTLCDPIDGSPPGSPIPGILQARTLEWVAISFSNAWKWKVNGSRSVMPDSSQPHGLQPTRLLCPWDFPGKSTGAIAFSTVPF